MTRTMPAFSAAVFCIMVAAAPCRAAPQVPADQAPQPQLPPMPSMEGAQGDTGKPLPIAPAKPKTKPPHAKRPGAKPSAAAKPAGRAKVQKPAR